MANKRRSGQAVGFAVLLALGGFAAWVRSGTEPTPPGPAGFVRYEHATRLSTVFQDLRTRGVIRNARAFEVYSWFTHRPQFVTAGTYSVAPGMTANALLHELTNPIRQRVRLPETNWSQRTANLLQEHDVANADDYMYLVRHPHEFDADVSFPLEGATLEGYLYPDTYDLPPLIGARAVILRQLHAFDKKVWIPLHPKDLYRTLIVASMVQMETGRASDAPTIAGVIENRLKHNMPLQIDAGINFALQKMRRLYNSDYRDVLSPYNTYLHTGLPPGPICSPTAKSVLAAMHPAQHEFLYYVALPTGESLFSKTYDEHLKRIAQRRHAVALAAKSGMKPAAQTGGG